MSTTEKSIRLTTKKLDDNSLNGVLEFLQKSFKNFK